MIQFLDLISPSLKQKIALVIFEEPLTLNSLMKGMHRLNQIQDRMNKMGMISNASTMVAEGGMKQS